MNILILNWKDIRNPAVGGAEVIAFNFARKLVKEGHAVVFFARSFAGAVPKETIDGVTIIRKGNLLTVYLHAYFYYRNLKKKPDVVVDMVNTLCWQTPLYAKQSSVWMYVNQLAKEVFMYELPFPLSWISYYLERFEYMPYRNANALCYSRSTQQDLVSFGLTEKNIRLFPMGLDHDKYIPGKKKTAYPLFLFVARLVRMKRADLCILAMKEVITKHPDARLAIVGNGPDEMRLRKMIEENGLTDNAYIVDKNNFFIDKHAGDPKVELMQQAWCLLLPSVKEGWGMVVTEAAACGTPSIVTNVTGLCDSVQHGKTGLILQPNPSPKELADAMCKVIEDDKLRTKLTKGALEWAGNFNWERSYKGFKNIILS